VFSRGPMTTAFTLNYEPAIDESSLLNMLNNSQPTLAWSISNGGSGSGLVSLAIAAQLGGYKQAPLKADKTVFGYDVTGEFIGNTTNVGNSGAYGPAQITLENAVPSY
jgi:hypothetical protein